MSDPSQDGSADADETSKRGSFLTGLRGRLLLLTVGLVLMGLMLIYPLLAANYRYGWLNERAQAAQIASLAVEAAPDGRVSDELSVELLEQAQVIAVAVIGEDFRELVLAPSAPINGPIVPVDLNAQSGMSAPMGALQTVFAPPGRFLLIRMSSPMTPEETMEVIVPEAALKADLIAYSRNLMIVSLIVAAIVGAVVYFAIYGLVVRPMRELTGAIVKFGEAPEGAGAGFRAVGSHEMRKAHEAMSTMQETVSAALRQRKRLADLGEVVAKINHDLRNSLATAQIVSESLSQSEDPRVRSAAPRLERAIRRAVGLAESTLSYGKAEPPGPQLLSIDIAPLLKDAAEEALQAWPKVSVDVVCPSGLMARVDPDHVHRIVTNLCRNAARAIVDGPGGGSGSGVTIRSERLNGAVVVEISDTGPGISSRVLPKLFQPFAASSSRDGAGLGLAISRELARGMGGELELARTGDDGAVFRLSVPAATS